MANKNIPDPGFSDDDGTADPRLAAALTAWSQDRTAHGPVLEALAGARLLVLVVAVLGEVEVDENGLRREKTSDMAVPTLKAGGRKALPAFTSIEALALWDPAARPVAVPLHQALQAAAHEQADTIVLDLAGPVPYELGRAALIALAEGRASADPLADPAVTGAVRAAVAAEARRAPCPPRPRQLRRHPRPGPRPVRGPRRGRPAPGPPHRRRRNTEGPPGARPRPGTPAGRGHATGRAPLRTYGVSYVCTYVRSDLRTHGVRAQPKTGPVYFSPGP